MTNYENQLRQDLDDLASTAPHVTAEGLATAAPRSVARSSRWTPIAGAAAAAFIIGGGLVLGYALDPRDAPPEVGVANEPTSAPTPDAVTKREASAFVHDLQGIYGAKVNPAIDWDLGRILVPVSGPIPAELARLDATSVSGLAVDIFPANVSTAAYNDFIRATAVASFAGKDLVCSFGLDAASSHIEVRVWGLEQLSAEERSNLQEFLGQLTPARISLVNAPEFHELSGEQDSGGAC